MFKTLELPGGFALDPLGALSGPQTPRPIILHPPFLIPGYGPVLNTCVRYIRKARVLGNTYMFNMC